MPTPPKSFDQPDRVLEAPGVREEVVELGDLVLGRVTHEPGWRWSTHIAPIVGTERCQARHLGIVISGHWAIEMPDGTVYQGAPGTVFDVPPGHDGWVIGDEPLVTIEWAGAIEWLMPAHGQRLLASLLFTDIVDSTVHAKRLGDAGLRQLMARHDEIVRALLASARGREIKSTGDGFLAVFEGPARAIHTALQIRDRVRAIGLEVRQGIHVGEVEVVGSDVRGLAVHQAARVMSAAGPGDVFVSHITRLLTDSTGYRFTSQGAHELKGLPGTHELYAVETGSEGSTA